MHAIARSVSFRAAAPSACRCEFPLCQWKWRGSQKLLGGQTHHRLRLPACFALSAELVLCIGARDEIRSILRPELLTIPIGSSPSDIFGPDPPKLALHRIRARSFLRRNRKALTHSLQHGQ